MERARVNGKLARYQSHSIRDFIIQDFAREMSTKAHEEALPLIQLFFEEGNPAGIKAAMHHLGLCENILRLPLIPVSENLLGRIEKAIKAL